MVGHVVLVLVLVKVVVGHGDSSRDSVSSEIKVSYMLNVINVQNCSEHYCKKNSISRISINECFFSFVSFFSTTQLSQSVFASAEQVCHETGNSQGFSSPPYQTFKKHSYTFALIAKYLR